TTFETVTEFKIKTREE
ncbi:hypothetical protein ABHA61_10240, partial [Enterococcus faecium]